MAASTGSPASRRSTKLTPLTTRPSATSRQGMMRVFSMDGPSIARPYCPARPRSARPAGFDPPEDRRGCLHLYLCRRLKPEVPPAGILFFKVKGKGAGSKCREGGAKVERAVVEGAAQDGTGDRPRVAEREDVRKRGDAAAGDHRDRDGAGKGGRGRDIRSL